MNEQTLLASTMALPAFRQWCWDHGVAHVAENLQSIHHVTHTEEYKAFAYPYIQNTGYLVSFLRYCTGDEYTRHRDKVALAVECATRKEAEHKSVLDQLQAKKAEVRRLDSLCKQQKIINDAHQGEIDNINRQHRQEIEELKDNLPMLSLVQYVSSDRDKLKEIQKRLVNAVRSEIEQLEQDYSGGAVVTRKGRDKVER